MRPFNHTVRKTFPFHSQPNRSIHEYSNVKDLALDVRKPLPKPTIKVYFNRLETMDQTTHKIDPGGDVVLILRNPSAPFAVMVEPLTDSESAPSPAPSTSPTKTQTICSSSEPNPSEYRYLVSSRHLILASKYFKTTLQGPWKEATSTDADGRHTIHAHDWDPSALLVLMHILHNRPNSVPREIDLEEFAKLAVLVDYYRCHEVVSIYADIWKSKLSVCVPTKCNREFILWLVVALVFQFKDTLKHMQEVALLHSVEQIPTLGLPIAAISGRLLELRS
ncbi:hypothetical protein F5Y04DRAFT_251680 [Hypomontagnella monticulosa]|nr:hypothetical protein F5Y04DRAFT_251680 [Hypomontagnella monticulosa]